MCGLFSALAAASFVISIKRQNGDFAVPRSAVQAGRLVGFQAPRKGEG